MSAPYDPNQGGYYPPQQGQYGYPPGQAYPPPQPQQQMQYQPAPPPQEEKSHGLSLHSAAAGSAARPASVVLSASTAAVKPNNIA
ncbi:hypothetical protein FOYG_04195 [Fusarium oxysporum NRRL 32931]|uniref:Cysteine-rich transmembrane CYSTM domain-containing protein n=1 Tax=Fusarium oxysporum NRRL 32931 TaxID=660029 RepID=W9IKC6_FUSOX|nr:hypothetical protein FOYG_04195 [Fusarium oxysporum NRRL 32931]